MGHDNQPTAPDEGYAATKPKPLQIPVPFRDFESRQKLADTDASKLKKWPLWTRCFRDLNNENAVQRKYLDVPCIDAIKRLVTSDPRSSDDTRHQQRHAANLAASVFEEFAHRFTESVSTVQQFSTRGRTKAGM